MANPTWIWKNGKLVPHDEATFHVGTPALHFGPAVFEGVRSYALGDGRANLFRLDAHLERLHASARIFNFDIPYSPAELAAACRETVLANDQVDSYVRPIAFIGGQALGFGRPGKTQTCVLSYPWDNRHLVNSQKSGIRAFVSSVIRTECQPGMSKSKVSANYAAGLLAVQQARAAGYDEALLLDASGAVAEAATSNLFAVWGERLVTPPGELPILLGVTRDTLLVLANELGIDVVEERFTRDKLLVADEVFLSGTTSEITPVREVDGRTIGDGAPGKITRILLGALQDAIRGIGRDRGWTHWLKE